MTVGIDRGLLDLDRVVVEGDVVGVQPVLDGVEHRGRQLDPLHDLDDVFGVQGTATARTQHQTIPMFLGELAR
ncbi:MAG: hypothetical protein R2710_19070 [Acidimicrobiales bacterium]